jgi:TldD protein
MKRRDFVGLTGLGATALLLPSLYSFGAKRVDPARLLEPGADTILKKRLADAALNAAKSAGASYADVRIGRSLNQYVFAREKQIQNIVSTESYGVGIRVLVNGCWGFASTSVVTEASLAATARVAADIAKANKLVMKEPVQLAPQQGYGEVSWKTPLQQSAFEVPVKQKADLLLAANAKALDAGASYISSSLFQTNEQKYFASTDGSYIDQDVHRLWPTFSATAVDTKTGKFRSREALSAPVGMGYEYLAPPSKCAARRAPTPSATSCATTSWPMPQWPASRLRPS